MAMKLPHSAAGRDGFPAGKAPIHEEENFRREAVRKGGRQVAEGMRLQEQLRKKARDTLPFFDWRQCLREPILLWDEGDVEAARICGEVMESPFGILCRNRFGKSTGHLLDLVLERLCKQNLAETFSCPEGFYLLWVGSDPQPEWGFPVLKKARDSGVPVILDACVLMEEGGVLGQPAEGIRYRWRIAPGRLETSSTLSALLTAGAFLRESVVTGAGEARTFWVRSMLYNSVERDLAYQLQERLEAILFGGSADWRERFRKEFSLPAWKREQILQGIPHPQDLPMIGDPEALRQQSRGVAKRIFQTWFRRGTDGATVTVEGALGHLFGRLGERCMPVWLMDQLPEVLLKRCGKCAVDMQLIRWCWRLPLKFLLYTAAQCTEELYANAQAQYKKSKQQCEDALQKGFTIQGTQPEQLMAGLKGYWEKWETCAGCALEASWWGAVKRLVCSQEIKQAVQEKWDALQSELAVLRPAAARRRPDSGMYSGASEDWRETSTAEILTGLISRAEFQDGDLTALLQDIQSQADKAIDAWRYRQTMLFADPDQLPRLERLRDEGGNPLLAADGRGGLQGLSNTAKPRVVAIPSLGPYTLWEVSFDAEPVQTGGGEDG